MNVITVPKKITKGDELVIIPLREYEKFLYFKNNDERETVTENDVLRWSQEARRLKKTGKLPLFRNFIKREYPNIARKYRI